MEKDLLQDQARTMDGLCFKKLELVFASSRVLLAFYISSWGEMSVEYLCPFFKLVSLCVAELFAFLYSLDTRSLSDT